MSTQDPDEVRQEVKVKFYALTCAVTRAEAKGDWAAVIGLVTGFLRYVEDLEKKQPHENELNSWLQQIAANVKKDLQKAIVGAGCESTILPYLIKIAQSTIDRKNEQEEKLFEWATSCFWSIYERNLGQGKDLYIPGFPTDEHPPLEIPPGPLGDLYDRDGTLLWGLD